MTEDLAPRAPSHDDEVARLVALPVEQLLDQVEIAEGYLADAEAWQKAIHEALAQRYGAKVKRAFAKAKKVGGKVHVTDGPAVIDVEIDKVVTWAQDLMLKGRGRIETRGEKPEDYLKVEYGISERLWTSGPEWLRKMFAKARHVRLRNARFKVRRADAEQKAA